MAHGAFQKTALDRKPHLEVIGADQLLGLGRHGRRFAHGARRQKFAGIIMLRIGENLGCRALLDNLAALHDTDLVRDPAHDAQIMGDEQKAHILGPLQLGQQVKDLRLNGHVQRGGGFIRDQHIGLVGQRHGNHHPLPLPARQLMRIGAKPAFGIADTDLLQQLDDPRPRRIAHDPLMKGQRLGQLAFQRMQRVQAGHRFLKDEADVIAAHLAQQRVIRTDHLLPVIGDRARHLRAVTQQRHGAKGGHGLARAAFAHQSHRLPALQRETDTAHRMGQLAVLPERDIQILDLKQAH